MGGRARHAPDDAGGFILCDHAATGGNVIAQDEASSVVWGMPGAAANAGICAAILPLNQIGAKVNRLFAGDRS